MGIGFDETSMTGVTRRQIAGDVIAGGDPGYDEARRVWNGMIDRRPRAIVRASEASDIGPAVALSREHGFAGRPRRRPQRGRSRDGGRGPGPRPGRAPGGRG
jgi:hypothetical protein